MQLTEARQLTPHRFRRLTARRTGFFRDFALRSVQIKTDRQLQLCVDASNCRYPEVTER